MADEVAKIQLVIDASGAKRGADEFAAAGQRVIAVERQVQQAEEKAASTTEAAAARKTAARRTAAAAGDAAARSEIASAAAGADVFAKSTDRIVTSLSSQSRFLASAARAYDPLNAAVAKAQGDINRLGGIAAGGGDNAARASSLLAGAQERLATVQRAASLATNDNIKGVGGLAEAHTRLSTQGMEAFHVMRSVTEQMAIGAPPTMILAQHLSQLSYAASGPGGLKGAFGEAITVLRGFITPMTAVVAGLAAVAAGVVYLASRAADANQSMRVFGVLLKGMGAEALSDVASLEAAAKGLRDVGLTAAEGRAAIAAVTQAGLNPAAADRIIRTGADLTAFRGGDQTKALTQALAGGIDTAVRYALEVKAIGVAEAGAALEAARLGNAQQAVDAIFLKITEHAKRLAEDALSPSAKAMREMKTAWSQAMDDMMNTRPIGVAVAALNELAKTISAIAKGMADIKAIGTGAAAGAAAGAVIGSAVGMPWAGAIIGGVAGGISGASISRRPGDRAEIPAATSGGPVNINADTIQIGLDYFQNKGLTFAQSAGVVGRMANESGGGTRLNPAAVNPTSGAFGIAQWLGGREAPLGGSTDLMRQLDLVWQEFQTTERKAFEKIIKTTTAEDAAIAMESFERAGNPAFTQSSARVAANIAGTRQSAGGVFDLSAAQIAQRESAGAAGSPSVGTPTINNQALSQAKEYAVAQKALAEATAGVGLEQDKLRIATEVLQNKEFENLTTVQKSALTRDLQSAATTRVTEEQHRLTEATELETSATKSIAQAYGQSAEAGLRAEHAAQAQRDAYQSLGQSTDKTALKFRFLRENALTVAQEMKAFLEIQKSINERTNQGQVLQLQGSMLGQTPEVVQAATTKLQEIQRLRSLGVDLSDKTAQTDLASVDALNKQTIALAEQQRAWQRIEDMVRGVADTIASTLTSAIAGLFDKSKATDWMATIKQGLSSIGSQLISGTLVKPLIGSVLGGLGFGNVASGFGNLFGGSSSGSGGGGLLGSLFGGGSSSSTNLTNGNIVISNDNGKLSIKQFGDLAQNGGGLLNALSDGTTGGLRTGLSSLLFGSGAVNSGFAAGTGAGAGIFTNLATGVTSDILPSVATAATEGISGGLLGGLGLGGSAISGLSSFIPYVGPIIGIASTLFGSLIGNKKPPNLVSTGGIDLTGGGKTVANPFSSGNPQNDAQAKQITDSISSFTKSILKLTGGSISGNIDVQAGSRDGIKIGGTLGSVATGLVGEMKFRDAQSAISATTLAIAQHLEGISDTMKTVLGSLTDPAQLQEAITFANTYENLDKAFKSGFAGIETITNSVGPFSQALDQVNATFQDMTDKATTFGLSLDPVVAGLAKANEALTKGFRQSIEVQLSSASGQGNDFLTQLQASQQRLSQNIGDQAALKLADNSTISEKIGTIFNKQIMAIAATLDLSQMQEAVSVFSESAPLIAEAMQRLIDTGKYLPPVLDAATLALKEFAKPLQALADSLTSGPLSGLNPVQMLAAANDNFKRELALVQGGNFAESTNLAAAGTNTIQLSQAAYGNGPATARLRSEILEATLSAVSQVLAGRGFAGGTSSTPPGWIQVHRDEWIQQGGGDVVLPRGRTPPGGGSNAELAHEIRSMRATLEGGNRIAQTVGVEMTGHLGEISGNTRRGVSLTEPPRRSVA